MEENVVVENLQKNRQNVENVVNAEHVKKEDEIDFFLFKKIFCYI